MNHFLCTTSACVAMALTVVGVTPVRGNGASPMRGLGDSFIFLPVMQMVVPPCDQTAVAQLKSASQWQGNFSIAFKGNASGPWPSGDSEVVSVDRVIRINALVLTKTHDSPTFVQWQVGGLVSTGQLTVNDRDVYTFQGGGTAELLAQFTETASTDVLSIILYPDQCKLRFNLDGIAVGPVTGDLKPNNEFDFCATLDILSPRAGAQSLALSMPVFVTSAEESSFANARRVGLHCRVGGGLPDAPSERFSNKLAWVLDGGTTSGARGKGDAPVGAATVTYSFVPQP